MCRILGSVLIGATLAVAACSAGSVGPAPGATGGAAGSAGSAGAAGNPTPSGNAGASGAMGGRGGASEGGTGGTPPAADASPRGGSTGRDASTATDAPAFGNPSRPVMPSAGCGKVNPATGSRTVVTGGQMGMFNVALPTGYNATTPVPLGFGFHGANNPACGPTQGECQGFAMLPAVTVYMKSFGTNWESATLEQNVTFFQDVLALAKNEYCVDLNRIFIAGVSSGGQFIEILTCRFGDTLWQVTPVSASVVRAADMNCKGTPPILVIHGVTDMAGNFGQDVAAQFARRNGCSATPPAGLAQARTDMMTAFSAMQVQHVCLDWDGCTLNPVRFCISSQITYSGLTHGWPRIGGMLISDFLGTVR